MDYFVYALEHIYTDDTHTDSKFLGYFDDIAKVEEAKINALKLPGFRTYPDRLITKKYQLNKIHWQDGFDNVIGEIGRDYLVDVDVLNENCKSIQLLNLTYIFKICHIYTIDAFLDDERIIGVYLDEKKAGKVMRNLKKMPGFRDHHNDFIIDKFTLNNQLWTTGF